MSAPRAAEFVADQLPANPVLYLGRIIFQEPILNVLRNWIYRGQKSLAICALSALNLVFCNVYGQTDTEFWFAAPDVSIGSNAFDTPIVLRFTTLQQPSTVTVTQPANPGFTPIVTPIPANSTATVNLSAFLAQVETAPPNTVLNTGLRITATAPVGAYYEVVSAQCLCNPEIFALKGQNALGTDFYVPFQNYLNNGNYTPVPYAVMIVVATEDNTSVTITPTQALVGHPAGLPFTIQLNQGQTWAGMATSQNAAAHPGGTRITSNRPIAVTMSDDLLSGAPFGGCADLLGDQIVPTWRVGDEYIIMKGALNGPDRIFIVGIQNGTTITLGGAPSGTVNAGQTASLDITQPSTYLQTSSPVYVLHMSGFGCEVGGAILPPIVCTGSTQLGFTRSTQEQFALNLMTRAGNESGFTLNGNAALIPAGAFAPVPNSGGEWVSAQIYFSTAQIPQGSGNIIANSLGKFHMGIIHGSGSSGTRYGYFSDFSVVEPPVIVAASSVCAGEDLALQAFSDPGATFSWSGPQGFQSDQQSPVIGQIAENQAGSYTVIAELDGCFSNPESVSVEVEVCGETASGVINVYTPVLSADPCQRSITVSDASLFSGITRALIIQMNGALAVPDDAPSHGDLIDSGSAGRYEYVTLNGATGNTLFLEYDLIHAYDFSSAVQLISVPQYENLIVSQTLTAQPWNGSTGGVLVFDVSGQLTLQADIDVTGTGFRGGAQSLSYYQGCSSMGYVYDYAIGIAGQRGESIASAAPGAGAGRGKWVNGGGGGNHVNAGGGGGSNCGSGGLGGDQWSGCSVLPLGGIGGIQLNYSPGGDRVFLGGGGGGGQQNDQVGTPGARGGGIVMLRAGSISPGGNEIKADGALVSAVAANDGCGGGGGGGVIMIDCPNVLAPLNVRARGGRGGSTSTTNHGPGGGGGGGVVWLSGVGSPNITAVVTGGLAGQASNGTSYGAQPGTNGLVLNGLQWTENLTADDAQGNVQIEGATQYCEGETIQLSVVAENAASITWSGPQGFSGSDQAIQRQGAMPGFSGVYSVVVADMFGCQLTGELLVSVWPVQSTVIQASFCEGSQYTLPDGINTTVPGEYAMTLVSQVSGCDSIVSVSLIMLPVESVDLDVSICQGQSHQLPGGGTVSSAGSYVSESVNPVSGCPLVITTHLAVWPTYSTTIQAAICSGESHVLPDGQSVSLAGTYPVVLTTSAGCDSIQNIALTVHPLPMAAFAWDPEKPDFINPRVELSNLSLNATSWFWDFGASGTSSEENPLLLLPAGVPGFYPVCLSVLSEEGCADAECGVIPVVADLTFFCPNAFTPGDDLINDVFRPLISGHDPDDYLFQVFNRWGDLIFETRDFSEGWPGNNRGGAFYTQNEVYLWRAEVRRIGDSLRTEYAGHVVVIR